LADDSDKESKTEEPTEKRRTDTLEKKGGPFSREVGSAAVLLAAAFLVATIAPSLMGNTLRRLALLIENPGGYRLENGADAIMLLKAVMLAASGFVLIFAGVVAAAAIAASVLQNTPRFMADRIVPDLSRISPGAGFNRLFNIQGLAELLKGVAKIVLVGLAGLWGLGGIESGFHALHAPPEAIPVIIGNLASRIVLFSALLATVIAAADIFVARHQWIVQLRMTKQEVKDEIKQTEGDLAFKARLRAIARARIKRRMMLSVPQATLVIANPTHYSVALRYVKGKDSAPTVMAKGVDAFALKIREIAERHNIPVVEDRLLARTLYEAVEIDQQIPPDFYKAVAEIIIFLSKKRRPGGGTGEDGPPPGRLN
jgi:flagellar biosynthesis protein FlhB